MSDFLSWLSPRKLRVRFAKMILCRDGALSLLCFIAAGLISLSPELQFRLEFNIYARYFTNTWLLHAAQYVLVNVLALLAFRGFTYQVSLAIVLWISNMIRCPIALVHPLVRWQSRPNWILNEKSCIILPIFAIVNESLIIKNHRNCPARRQMQARGETQSLIACVLL